MQRKKEMKTRFTVVIMKLEVEGMWVDCPECCVTYWNGTLVYAQAC